MPKDFNKFHWAYTLGVDVAAKVCVFTPGKNGHKSLDTFDARALAHYRYGLKQGRAILKESRE